MHLISFTDDVYTERNMLVHEWEKCFMGHFMLSKLVPRSGQLFKVLPRPMSEEASPDVSSTSTVTV